MVHNHTSSQRQKLPNHRVEISQKILHPLLGRFHIASGLGRDADEALVAAAVEHGAGDFGYLEGIFVGHGFAAHVEPVVDQLTLFSHSVHRAYQLDLFPTQFQGRALRGHLVPAAARHAVFGGMDAYGFGAAIEVAQVHGRLFGLRGPGK